MRGPGRSLQLQGRDSSLEPSVPRSTSPAQSDTMFNPTLPTPSPHPLPQQPLSSLLLHSSLRSTDTISSSPSAPVKLPDLHGMHGVLFEINFAIQAGSAAPSFSDSVSPSYLEAPSKGSTTPSSTDCLATPNHIVPSHPGSNRDLTFTTAALDMSREAFDNIANAYLSSLTKANREKALMPRIKYDNVLAVLRSFCERNEDLVSHLNHTPSPASQSDSSALVVNLHTSDELSEAIAARSGGSSNTNDPSNPQFRHWVRKTFTLIRRSEVTQELIHFRESDLEVVALGGKPVAVQEALYEILTRFHRDLGHAGRDRTYIAVCEHYVSVIKRSYVSGKFELTMFRVLVLKT